MALLIFVVLVVFVLASALLSNRIDLWQATASTFLLCLMLSSGPLAAYATVGRVPLAVLLLGMTVRIARHGRSRPWIDRLTIPMWICVAVAGVSIVPSYSWVDTLIYVILLWLLVTLIRQVAYRRWVSEDVITGDLVVIFWTVALFVLVGLVSSAVGLYQNGGSDRIAGFFGNPNMQGNIAALIAILGASLWIGSGKRSYLFCSLALTASAFFSGSRTAIAALAIAALLALLMAPVKAKLSFIMSAGVIACLALLFYPYVGLSTGSLTGDIGARLFSSDDLTLSNRTVVWEVAGKLIQENPYGLGFGVAPQYFSTSANSIVSYLDRTSVHNSYLQWVLEAGWVSALPLLMLLIVVIAMVVASAFHDHSSVLATVLLAGLLIQTTESMIFGMGQIYPWLYWLVAGGVATLLDIRAQREREIKRSERLPTGLA